MAFLLPTNLAVGRGIERAALNYAAFRPSWVDVTIFHSDFDDASRLSLPEIESRLHDAHLVRVRLLYGAVQRLKAKNLGMVALYGFLIPITSWMARRTVNRKASASMAEFDVVYLFNNAYSPAVPRGPVVIGSTHSTPPAHALAPTYRKFVSAGLLHVRVAGFHLLKDTPAWQFGRRFDFVLPIGIDTSRFRPSTEPKHGTPKFLFVGALDVSKGLATLLEAWKMLSRDGWHLTVVGKGPLEEEARRTPGVRVLTSVNDEDLARTYRESDVLVFPTSGESYAAVVVEALCSGLYVLAGDATRGDYDEFEGARVLEYVVPQAQPLALAMARLGESIDSVRSIDRGVAERVARRFDIRENSRRLFETLREIVSSMPSARRTLRVH